MACIDECPTQIKTIKGTSTVDGPFNYTRTFLVEGSYNGGRIVVGPGEFVPIPLVTNDPSTRFVTPGCETWECIDKDAITFKFSEWDKASLADAEPPCDIDAAIAEFKATKNPHGGVHNEMVTLNNIFIYAKFCCEDDKENENKRMNEITEQAKGAAATKEKSLVQQVKSQSLGGDDAKYSQENTVGAVGGLPTQPTGDMVTAAKSAASKMEGAVASSGAAAEKVTGTFASNVAIAAKMNDNESTTVGQSLQVDKTNSRLGESKALSTKNDMLRYDNAAHELNRVKVKYGEVKELQGVLIEAKSTATQLIGMGNEILKAVGMGTPQIPMSMGPVNIGAHKVQGVVPPQPQIDLPPIMSSSPIPPTDVMNDRSAMQAVTGAAAGIKAATDSVFASVMNELKASVGEIIANSLDYLSSMIARMENEVFSPGLIEQITAQLGNLQGLGVDLSKYGCPNLQDFSKIVGEAGLDLSGKFSFGSEMMQAVCAEVGIPEINPEIQEVITSMAAAKSEAIQISQQMSSRANLQNKINEIGTVPNNAAKAQMWVYGTTPRTTPGMDINTQISIPQMPKSTV